MTIESRLAEMRARVEAAAPGPWKFEQEGHSSCGEPACCSEDWDNRIWANGTVLLEDHQLTDADAEFIAASRTDLPGLLAAVEAVMELADRLEWEADPANHLGSDLDYCRIATAQRIRTALTAALEVEG